MNKFVFLNIKILNKVDWIDQHSQDKHQILQSNHNLGGNTIFIQIELIK